MLQTAAVYPETLDILNKIMESPTFHQFNLAGGTALALQLTINDLQIDFLKYPYPALVQDFKNIDGVRLVSVEDIAIMKLLAIARRGAKKDFFDIFFILREYTLNDLISYFKTKLPQVELFHILKSLTYFEDAEEDGDPIMLIEVSWKEVKNSITEKVTNYLRN